MSPELVGAFERHWPEVAQRLHGLLASKNVPACKRDDVVQETGLRLFGMWEKVDRNRPVWPLAVTIALNLMRDEARRNPQREVLAEVLPEMPAAHDVEDEGIARLELERVQVALAQLSPSHRDVLLKEIRPHDDVPKAARNATKMMRLRARRALATLLETAALRAGLVILKVRQTLGRNEQLVPITLRPGDSAAPATALVVAALLFGTIQVDAGSVAHASEVPAPADSSWGAGTLIGGQPASRALSLADEVMATRVSAFEAREAADDAARKRAAKEKKRKNDAKRRGTDRKWNAPSPEEAAPIVVALPIGDAHAGLVAGYGPAGVQVGNRYGNSTPVCLSGVEPAGLGCGTPPAKKARVRAGATADVNGEQVSVAVDEEVETGTGV